MGEESQIINGQWSFILTRNALQFQSATNQSRFVNQLTMILIVIDKTI